jgi:ERF superfamily
MPMATAQQPLSPEIVHHIPLKPPASESAALPSLTPVELLRIAVSQNANIDQLTKLMDLQERWERREAKRAYDAAMKTFKGESPRISKNSRVNFTTPKGTTDYRHATLDHVCDSVVSLLAKHGISHRWKVSQQAEWITVTCILTHELGHAEETSLTGCPDNTGNKNSIQAVGSTVTYLQRYTLLAATGLATSDQDDDGRGAAVAEGLSDERMEQLGSAIANSATLDDLKANYFTAYREAEETKDRTAKQLFVRTKDARKRELQ